MSLPVLFILCNIFHVIECHKHFSYKIRQSESKAVCTGGIHSLFPSNVCCLSGREQKLFAPPTTSAAALAMSSRDGLSYSQAPGIALVHMRLCDTANISVYRIMLSIDTSFSVCPV